MAGYFIGMHQYLRMKKALLATVSAAEFNTMSLNSKLSKVVSYIQDNKYCERIYVLLKIMFPCLRVLLPTFAKTQKIIQKVIIGNISTMLSTHYFMEHLKMKWLLLKIYLRLITLNLITRLVHLMRMNLYGKSKTVYSIHNMS